MLELVKQAKIGTIVPVYKELDNEIDALEYFAKLSNYGNKKNSILMQNNEKSFGSASPCLILTGKGIDFEIAPLNNLGKKFINLIKKDFKFCDKAIFSKGKIIGKLASINKSVSEDEKFKLKTHLDIIRTIAFKFKPTTKPFSPYCGLFGMISDNFINQSEDASDKDPDYIFYFVDNMFLVDHKTKKTYFVANALVIDNQKEKLYQECSKTIHNYEKLMEKKAPKGKKPKKKELKISYDTEKEEFLGLMSNLRKYILDGDILHASPSRTTITSYNSEPLDIYSQLKVNSPENVLFYVNDGNGISISSGATSFLRVSGQEKEVELSIYTNKTDRATTKDEMNNDLDNKYELLLKVDESGIAYNTMLIDAARNDVVRISETGTRFVSKLFSIDKHPTYQFISSSVKGTLKHDLDALHAYLATMNPVKGTPKTKSMQLLVELEKGNRSFTSAIYISPDEELKSMAIEPIRIKKNLAYFGTSSRVFHNSNDENEFKTVNNKEEKLLDAIRSAGGLK